MNIIRINMMNGFTMQSCSVTRADPFIRNQLDFLSEEQGLDQIEVA